MNIIYANVIDQHVQLEQVPGGAQIPPAGAIS